MGSEKSSLCEKNHHQPEVLCSFIKTKSEVIFHAKILLMLLMALWIPVVSSLAEKPTSSISFKPDMTVSYSIEKIQVIDCRAIRGFLGTPVDGSIHSWGYRGAKCEYPDTGKEGLITLRRTISPDYMLLYLSIKWRFIFMNTRSA